MNDFCALFDNNYVEGAPSFLYRNPVEFITCKTLSDATDCLNALEKAQERGLYSAGFISYEFAQHFGLASKAAPADGLPYLQFGLFRSREALGDDEVDAFLEARATTSQAAVLDIKHQTNPQNYDQAIAAIKEELEAGNSYQVNYTFESQMRVMGSPARLYKELRRAQAVPFGAYVDFPDATLLSRSPELFFKIEGSKITTRPMKGTEPRAKDNPVLDNINHWRLVTSEKQRAENLMIVDLLRNDLSRVSEFGSVEVEQLFEVETYETVHQMTSTISAIKRSDAGLSVILEALFPCGSVTGAPKHQTMQIIDRLEPHARGVYCGAIGMIAPNGDMSFSVPIRTMQVKGNRARFHIGGGVVYDSVDQSEYEEALLKGKFLFDLPKDFQALESFAYFAGQGAQNEAEHLARLNETTQALGFPFDEEEIRNALDALYAKTKYDAKIRLLIAQDGSIEIEAQMLDEFQGEKTVILSEQRTCADDPIYAYKTTNRALYNAEFKAARAKGAYDVIFANEEGNLTEAAIHNLVLRFGDDYVTPPLSAGLLPGVGRAKFLRDHPQTREENLPISALQEADEILLVSSTRGVVSVRLN